MERDGLERDTKLAALYAATATEAPPTALDDAIRAAARRAVGAKPRSFGSSFLRSWRGPMSIAAVVVLSVSLVTLMREESPELTEPPRADAPAGALERAPATSFPRDANDGVGLPKETPRSKETSGLGLKPARPGSASGLGMRSGSESTFSVEPRLNAADRSAPLIAPAPAAPSLARAFPGSDAPVASASARAPAPAPPPPSEQPSARAESNVGEQRSSAPRPAPPAPATEAASVRARGILSEESKLAKTEGGAESDRRERQELRPQAVPPAGKPALNRAPVAQSVPEARDASRDLETANLTPAKWLERIQALREQGRIAEAKASLTEFRKRYPEHPLPPNLKEWVAP